MISAESFGNRKPTSLEYGSVTTTISALPTPLVIILKQDCPSHCIVICKYLISHHVIANPARLASRSKRATAGEAICNYFTKFEFKMKAPNVQKNAPLILSTGVTRSFTIRPFVKDWTSDRAGSSTEL
jgi:hypothetical protein